MARCSAQSWVWNRASPVQHSTRIQPSDQRSIGWFQPKSCQCKLVVGFVSSTRTNPKDDFWCSVVACAHYRAVILVVKCRGAEVDQIDLWRQ
jgi:hypothetical protein